ncbi:hypothetical protein ABZ249_10790 [Nocardiopsis sp. NPDC006139]|uniref:hypothetical protein n=1 Tax=unclassified Nocardiopsis TaxID=2649073 RepID=UPI00159ABE75|nr:hypothetical protein HUT17_00365 [Nocardiopsis flavescens]
MPTTFHRARRLLAAGAIAGVAVFGVAACENTAEGGPVDTEEMSEEPMDDEMSEEPMEDGTEESGEMTDDMSGDDSMSEEPMEDDMSEEDPMDGEMSEEPMDDEG